MENEGFKVLRQLIRCFIYVELEKRKVIPKPFLIEGVTKADHGSKGPFLSSNLFSKKSK
jgi:hypothetical protein